MSSAERPMRWWELAVLTAVSLALFAWYATPQLFYVMYPLYELARLVVPSLVLGLAGGP